MWSSAARSLVAVHVPSRRTATTIPASVSFGRPLSVLGGAQFAFGAVGQGGDALGVDGAGPFQGGAGVGHERLALGAQSGAAVGFLAPHVGGPSCGGGGVLAVGTPDLSVAHGVLFSEMVGRW